MEQFFAFGLDTHPKRALCISLKASMILPKLSAFEKWRVVYLEYTNDRRIPTNRLLSTLPVMSLGIRIESKQHEELTFCFQCYNYNNKERTVENSFEFNQIDYTELRCNKTCFMTFAIIQMYAVHKSSDQTAHSRDLIRAVAIRIRLQRTLGLSDSIPENCLVLSY